MNSTMYWLIGTIVALIWAAVTCIIASNSYYNGFNEGYEAGKKARDGKRSEEV